LDISKGGGGGRASKVENRKAGGDIDYLLSKKKRRSHQETCHKVGGHKKNLRISKGGGSCLFGVRVESQHQRGCFLRCLENDISTKAIQEGERPRIPSSLSGLNKAPKTREAGRAGARGKGRTGGGTRRLSKGKRGRASMWEEYLSTGRKRVWIACFRKGTGGIYN